MDNLRINNFILVSPYIHFTCTVCFWPYNKAGWAGGGSAAGPWPASPTFGLFIIAHSLLCMVHIAATMWYVRGIWYRYLDSTCQD